jgi:hypothetical protein
VAVVCSVVRLMQPRKRRRRQRMSYRGRGTRGKNHVRRRPRFSRGLRGNGEAKAVAAATYVPGGGRSRRHGLAAAAATLARAAAAAASHVPGGGRSRGHGLAAAAVAYEGKGSYGGAGGGDAGCAGERSGGQGRAGRRRELLAAC